MSKEDLDAFLKGDGTPAPDAPTEAPEPAAPSPAPSGEPEPATPSDAPQETAEDGAPPAPREGDARTVPLAALEGERRQRQDWKEKAIRAETERDELRRQVEEAKRAAPPPEQRPPQPMDPMVEERVRIVIAARLDSSENSLRLEIGDDKVEALQAEFIEAMKADPSLQQKLYQQRDPYRWAMKQMEIRRAQSEIGDDPAAYKARLRAEWEAERATNGAASSPPAPSPAAGMAPSLASVRSAAPRSAPSFSGPPSLDDILGQRTARR